MSEASTAENQSATSPARQMLAALTQASKEMTAKFSEISERASKLNVALENDVSKSLEYINEQAESIVRNHLEGLAAEKDAVLAELTVLRQEELKVLQTIAKGLRDALSEKLDELSSAMKNDVRDQLLIFQQNIGRTETEVVKAETELRKALKEKLPEQLESIRQRIAENKKDLESAQFRQQGLLAQESRLLLEKLHEHGTELKGRLAKEQSNILESMETTVKEIAQTQGEKLEKHVQEFATLHEKARPLVDVEMDFLEQLPQSFSDACQQVSDLRVRMHKGSVSNLALVYRTEISSALTEAEDHLVVLRSHLQSKLRNYYEHYSEQSARLLEKFEQDINAAKPAPSESDKAEKEEEVPVDLFEKLKKEIDKTIKEIVTSAESEVEQSFSDFRARLNSGSQSASSVVESNFHECRKRVVELGESQREELDELSHKGDALEQLVGEAKDLIAALNPSNLEF